MADRPARLIALGASNLTRGLPALVAALRAQAGPGSEVVAALGLGRSYGLRSRVLARSLPGILDCGLWPALGGRPPVPTRALVSDVGNDILYGAPPDRILAWVEEAVVRLRAATDDVVIAGLPLPSLRGLSDARFLFFRTLLYPPARLGRAEAIEAAERVEDGLRGLADRHRARFVPMRPEWYGLDPVHFRPGRWGAAWRHILGFSGDAGTPSLPESVRLHLRVPERQWLFGIERRHPQQGDPAPGGGRVWLY